RKPLKILDLGGSDYYWQSLNFTDNENYKIEILNIENQNTENFKNISFLKKDVRDLSFIEDKEYDLIYSNSLIEHLNNFDEQKKLAKEIQRTGKKYFIQTPNYYFPVEPHFLFPFFQFLSVDMKTKLISNFNLGWFEKQTDIVKARELANSIKLLKEKELKEIFPGCKIYKEKYFSLNKSFIAYN
ncbi:MAG: class I SAM-dependent methyltransferase, partial [Ignavibacteria bacterium]|nr:class I SAM-dependent methyltransferase [Ignavibacteria bacterium]